jgi:branched-subunit amino acid transport protein
MIVFLNSVDYRFWLAVTAMALITWITRALPFFGGQRRLDALSRPESPLSMLGPSLLAAICVAVILPDLLRAAGNAVAAPYVLGLVATAVIANGVKNTGLAVLASIVAYSAFLAVYEVTVPSL